MCVYVCDKKKKKLMDCFMFEGELIRNSSCNQLAYIANVSSLKALIKNYFFHLISLLVCTYLLEGKDVSNDAFL